MIIIASILLVATPTTSYAQCLIDTPKQRAAWDRMRTEKPSGLPAHSRQYDLETAYIKFDRSKLETVTAARQFRQGFGVNVAAGTVYLADLGEGTNWTVMQDGQPLAYRAIGGLLVVEVPQAGVLRVAIGPSPAQTSLDVEVATEVAVKVVYQDAAASPSAWQKDLDALHADGWTVAGLGTRTVILQRKQRVELR